METTKPRFEKYLFVCENEKEGACCGKRGGVAIREMLKARVKEQGLADSIRVSRSGCLDVCIDGPNVLLMPDNVWFKGVEAKDVETILEKVKKCIGS